jgi:hypothetical protein
MGPIDWVGLFSLDVSPLAPPQVGDLGATSYLSVSLAPI